MHKIIAANWKMHKTRPEAAQEAAKLAQALANGAPDGRLAVVFPPFTDIATVADAFAGVANVAVGGQNFYPADHGAFTGEISPAMLRDAGAAWVLAGHSERRHVFHESDELIAKKTAFGLAEGFKIMLCIGETLKERDNGDLQGVLSRQISTAITPLPADVRGTLPNRLAIAYEPVWAIGTGRVAGEAEILDAHERTRKILTDILGSAAAQILILYGGSVKPANAASILALKNVDGLLVGGASLEAQSFLDIINAGIKA